MNDDFDDFDPSTLPRVIPPTRDSLVRGNYDLASLAKAAGNQELKNKYIQDALRIRRESDVRKTPRQNP